MVNLGGTGPAPHRASFHDVPAPPSRYPGQPGSDSRDEQPDGIGPVSPVAAERAYIVGNRNTAGVVVVSLNHQAEKPSCHRYALPDDWLVLAGRTARDNDVLSTRIANANDWWFHVKGMPGSHVILQDLRGGRTPDRQILEQAAAVAAFHSKARHAGVTAVSVSQVKYVGKPRDAKTGTVTVRRKQTLKVRPALPDTEPRSE